jgi:hypothetical protein
VLAICVGCAAGCTEFGLLPTSPDGPGQAHTPLGQPVAPDAALRAIALGKSTRSDVAAALGAAIVIRFDSGYEVWAYRWPGTDRTTRAATELVVLFNPAGVASKARIRPGSAEQGPAGGRSEDRQRERQALGGDLGTADSQLLWHRAGATDCLGQAEGLERTQLPRQRRASPP